MKKLGTPIGAGPGSASEYVGFVGAGTPGPLGRFGLVFGLGFGFCCFCFFCFFFFGLVLVLVFGRFVFCGRDDARWVRLGRVGRGGALLLDVDVDVDEDEPELEVEDPEELELVLGEELEVVLVEELELVVGEELELVLLEAGAVLDDELVVGVDEVVDTGAQDSLSETTTPWIGRFMAEIGVPGATLTLNVYVLPPTTVTFTVQASAKALGRWTSPNVVTAVATRVSGSSNFPLVGNC